MKRFYPRRILHELPPLRGPLHRPELKTATSSRLQGEYPNPSPGVMEETGYLSFALQCRHCEDAPCLNLHTGPCAETGERGGLADEERCVGAGCASWLSFRVISRNVEGKRVISKCNLCQGKKSRVREELSNEAIVFEEENEIRHRRKRACRDRRVEGFGRPTQGRITVISDEG